jgi:hypothetical protein
MRPTSPDCRRLHLLAVPAAAIALLSLQPASAASAANDKCTAREWTVGSELTTYASSGSVSIDELKASNCGTLLQATKAETNNSDSTFVNGTWKLSGKVRLEFNGELIETDIATIVLINGLVSSVNAGSGQAQSPTTKKPVHLELNGATLDVDTAAATFASGRIKTILAQGAPGQFSYQVKKSGQHVHGRSARIEYDADKTLITFTKASYFYGNDEAEAETLTYNFNDGSSSVKKGIGTYRPDERVPAPRTPDRATAK